MFHDQRYTINMHHYTSSSLWNSRLLHFIFPLIFTPSSLRLSFDIRTDLMSVSPSFFSIGLSFSASLSFPQARLLPKSTLSIDPIMVVFIVSYAQNLFKLLGWLVQQVITNLFIYNNFWDHKRSSLRVFKFTPGIPFTFINRSQVWIDFLLLCDYINQRFLQTMFIWSLA